MFRYSYILIDSLSSFGSPDGIADALAFLKKCGYAGVELNLNEPAGVNFDLLEQWLSGLELVVPSFLTGEAYNQGLCLSAKDSSIRQRTVNRLISYLDVAKRFNAILVVGLLQGLRSDESQADVANQRIADCLRQVARVAEDKGCELVIEPVNHLQVGFNNSVGEVQSLIQAIGSPAVKPMVDTIHMNIEESSMTGAIRSCGSSLRHVHLCESNGAKFGTGHIDFRTVLDTLTAIGYNGFASVKVYRGAPFHEAAPWSLEYLRKLA